MYKSYFQRGPGAPVDHPEIERAHDRGPFWLAEAQLDTYELNAGFIHSFISYYRWSEAQGPQPGCPIERVGV
jgi:hypothetical protein